MTVAVILVGYCYLIATFGLEGVCAIVAHLFIMALCTGKKDRT